MGNVIIDMCGKRWSPIHSSAGFRPGSGSQAPEARLREH